MNERGEIQRRTTIKPNPMRCPASPPATMKLIVLCLLIGSAIGAPEALPNLQKIAATAVAKAPNALSSLDGLTAIVKTILPGKSDQYYLSKHWIGKVLVTDMMMNLTVAISPSLLLLLIVGFFSMSTPDEQCPVKEDRSRTSRASQGQTVNVPRTFGNNNFIYRGTTSPQIRNRIKRESIEESKSGQRVRLFVRNHPDGPLKLIEEMRIKGGDDVKLRGIPKDESLLLKAITAPPLTRTGKINQLREENPLISQFLDINGYDQNYIGKFLSVSNTTKSPMFSPLPANFDISTKVPPIQSIQTQPTLTLSLKQVVQPN